MRAPVVETLHLDQRLLPARIFEEYTRQAAKQKDMKERSLQSWFEFGKPGRDPNRLGGVITSLATGGGWMPHMKVASLRHRWDTVVGPGIAAHSRVVSYKDGVLVVQAQTTVWATQLTYLVPQLKEAISKRLQMPVTEVRVTGPHNYSFRRGRFDPPGRGVRDTYG